jgi:exonuclease III
MESQFRAVTWNCRRATQSSPAWNYLCELAPDIALLQEVSSIPLNIKKEFDVQYKMAVGKTGNTQRFGSAVLVRGAIVRDLPLQSSEDWVNAEIERFVGNLLAFEVLLERGLRLNVVGVYSPAWPVKRARIPGVDVSSIKLTLNPDVWVADLLWAYLRSIDLHKDFWVVAGDFNLSETFDAWRGGPRGNREYLDRMAALGTTECLRKQKGKLTPTFRNPRDGLVIHQMDHLFVTDALASRLVSCDTGNPERVFGESLSDHLPIVADFVCQ